MLAEPICGGQVEFINLLKVITMGSSELGLEYSAFRDISLKKCKNRAYLSKTLKGRIVSSNIICQEMKTTCEKIETSIAFMHVIITHEYTS